MARTCLSLKLRESDDPRWPDVPNSIRSAGTEGSGCSLWYAVTSFGTFTKSDGLPASEWTFGSLTDPKGFSRRAPLARWVLSLEGLRWLWDLHHLHRER